MKFHSDFPLELLEHTARIIQHCNKGTVLSGAGISTPSGIPDFRSAIGGLWSQVDPFEIASLSVFKQHPERFYAWLRPLAQKIYLAKPNAAHSGITHLQQTGYIETIITQNIDGLHQKSGSTNVLELHGSLETLSCPRCGVKVNSTLLIKPYLEQGEIPLCQSCSSILKPDVILMEEMLPEQTLRNAIRTVKTCDFMMVLGSSLEVYPAAGLPGLALENGAFLIVINRDETYIDHQANVVIHDEVEKVIPELVKMVLSGVAGSS